MTDTCKTIGIFSGPLHGQQVTKPIIRYLMNVPSSCTIYLYAIVFTCLNYTCVSEVANNGILSHQYSEKSSDLRSFVRCVDLETCRCRAVVHNCVKNTLMWI